MYNSASYFRANVVNRIGILVFIVLFFGLFNAKQAFAIRSEIIEQPLITGGFNVGPGSFAIQANRGDVITQTIQITSEKNENSSAKITMEDFQGSTDNPNQSVDLQGANTGKYGAKDWFTPEVTDVNFVRGERVFLDVTIRVPQNADAGDHYAVVLINDTKKDSDNTKTSSDKAESNVKILTRIGVLFYVRVNGDIKEEGSVENFSVSRPWFENPPVDFRMLFKNSGSVRLETSGKIEIKNLLGSLVDVVNVEPLSTFRDSIRNRDVTWPGKGFLMGRYTAILSLNRGYDGIVDVREVSFWIIPWKKMLAVLAIIIIVVMVLRFILKNVDIKVGLKKKEN